MSAPRILTDPDTGELVEVLPLAVLDSTATYTFGDARRLAMVHHRERNTAEGNLAKRVREAAEAEREYRATLAVAIVECKAAHGATAGVEIAKGRDDVNTKREARDIAHGMVDVAKERLRLCSEDRASFHRLVEWSTQRERSEGQ